MHCTSTSGVRVSMATVLINLHKVLYGYSLESSAFPMLDMLSDMQIRRNKFAYFLNFWNLLDLVLILLSLLCIAFDIYRSQAVSNKLGQLLQNDQIFMDFDFLSYWQVQFNNAVAWALFIAYIKAF